MWLCAKISEFNGEPFNDTDLVCCDQTCLTKDGRSLGDRIVGYRPTGAELKMREISSQRHGWTLNNFLIGNGDFHFVVVRPDK